MKTGVGVMQLCGGQVCFFCYRRGSMTYCQIEIRTRTYKHILLYIYTSTNDRNRICLLYI